MPSSTFKGLYPECNECVYQFYDNIKNKNNCSFSHKKIRSNANSTGTKYERDFRWCGLKQKKKEYQMKKALKILKRAEDVGYSRKQIRISSDKLNKAIKELEDLKNRSCNTCKYGHPYSGKYVECSNTKTETEGLAFKENFYCKNYEFDTRGKSI